MGLFGGIIHAITSPVEHLIGHTATNIIFPAVPLTKIATGLGEKVIGSVGRIGQTTAAKAPFSPGVQQIHQGAGPALYGRTPAYNVSYGAPTYSFGGGGGFDQSYPPAETFQGGSPWGYSTQYSQPLIMPYQAYSAPAQDRTWEDLALTGLSLL